MGRIVEENELEGVLNDELVSYVYNFFKSFDFVIYGVKQGEHIDILAKGQKECLYIERGDSLSFCSFRVLYGKLSSICFPDFTLFLDEKISLLSGDDYEETIDLVKLDKPDVDEYDGRIIYKQYDLKNGKALEIQYRQMYREAYQKGQRPPIYDFKMEVMQDIYFDSEYNEKKKKYGKTKYFTRIVNDDSKDNYYVLVNFANKTAERGIVMPFAKKYSEEEMNEMIKNSGFTRNVSKNLLDAYNGSSRLVEYIDGLIKELNELEKCNDSKGLRLKLNEEN